MQARFPRQKPEPYRDALLPPPENPELPRSTQDPLRPIPEAADHSAGRSRFRSRPCRPLPLRDQSPPLPRPTPSPPDPTVAQAVSDSRPAAYSAGRNEYGAALLLPPCAPLFELEQA